MKGFLIFLCYLCRLKTIAAHIQNYEKTAY